MMSTDSSFCEGLRPGIIFTLLVNVERIDTGTLL